MRTDFEFFDWHKKSGRHIGVTYEQRVFERVQRLIDSLYYPHGEPGMYSVDKERLKLYGISNESINWGSLNLADVKEYKDGSFEVTIEEASPGNCPTFCAYIEKYMKAWGWRVTVKTEW
jgi:hypothetical protein